MMTFDILKVWVKSLVSEKGTGKALKKLITATIGYAASIFSFSVLLNDLANFDKLEIYWKNHWWFLFVLGFICSLFHNHEKISCKGIQRDNDQQIEVKINNLFSIKASSYVIPTNSFFRTIMDDEYVSPRSVQGAFQLKYFRKDKNFNTLDQKIAESLNKQGLEGIDDEDIHGPVKKYPLGTVAKVDHKNKHFYFVAINDVNKYGKPENQTYGNIDIALTGLVEAINKMGHCDDFAMPLLGTGRAAIKDASIDKVVMDIVDKFSDSHDKIARKLIICIRPGDYLDGLVNLKRIGKYIDYKCEFK